MRKLSIIRDEILHGVHQPYHSAYVGLGPLLTPMEILTRKSFDRPFVIRPTEFPDFETLLEHRDEIRDLKLVPVKDDATHAKYNSMDKEALFDELRNIMNGSSITLMPNEFQYWLSPDVDQNLVWIREDAEHNDVVEFIGKCLHHFNIPMNEVILFERPLNIDSTLVKGSFPQMRHIHFWIKK